MDAPVSARYSQALEGLGTFVQDLQSDLQHATADCDYWRGEAETFRRKYLDEKARSERVRRILSLLQPPPGSPRAATGAAALPHLLPPVGRLKSLLRRGAALEGDGGRARLARASYDGTTGHEARPPPLLAPQGSDPTGADGGAAASTSGGGGGSSGGGAAVAVAVAALPHASAPSGPRRALSMPNGAAAAAAAAARLAAAGHLGGAAGAAGSVLDSPKLRRQTVESLFSMMMAYTVAHNVAAGGMGDEDTEEPLSSISIDDDDGTSGVGLAAAAAAAAAMARAWAKAASREQRDAGSGAGAPGSALASGASGGGCKAGFRLVATVTNKMGKRRPSHAVLTASPSQDSLGTDPSPFASTQSLPALVAGGGAAAAAGAGANGRPGSAGTLPPAGPSAAAARAAAAAAAAAAGAGSDASAGSSPATPAAAAPANSSGWGSGQGSNIALHWLSRPRNVLVMRKLAVSTEGTFQAAVEWLLEHHVNVHVEPSVFAEVSARAEAHKAARGAAAGDAAARRHAQQQQDAAAAAAAAAGGGGGGAQQHAAGMSVSEGGVPRGARPDSGGAPSVSFADAGHGRDGSSGGGAPPGELRTWAVEPGAPGDYLPEALSNALDFVVVFGGDGTVLWTCHMFGNRSVPPLVPFNLGSLGFLTPFEPAATRRVLQRIVRGGFPIQLRHRLHCTLLRSSALPEGAAAAAAGAPGRNAASTRPGFDISGMPALPAGIAAFAEGNGCPSGVCLASEERVVLNEVVLDRGISPFLTNLETYCDGNFVTHVQGDGLIVATPTGSTAYSLAAGGSMVHPQVPCILFTPICPHSLSFRPLMFPDSVVLCIRVPQGIRSQVWCSFDGKERTELHPGDAMLIRLSKWPLPTVTSAADASTDWFGSVRQNLGWNARKLQGGAGQ